MQLKDICDMTEYLAERCYCPGEIYESSGFFFQIFQPEEECRVLVKGHAHDDENVQVIAVICRDQIIIIWHQNSRIEDALRFDATDNNMKQIHEYYRGLRNDVVLDEFKEGSTARDLLTILEHADAIIVD